MFYNGLILEFKRELILYNMKPLSKRHFLALKLESSVKAPLNTSLLSKPESGVLRVRDMDTMLMSAP